MAQHALRSCFFATVWLLIHYDIFARLYWGNDATISVVLHDLGREHPIVTFGLGGVMFHIFWCIAR